jgi:carbon starvation protein CstA
MLVWQIENPDGFNTIWQYFGFSNQALSAFTLWALTVYLVRYKKLYLITLIPALFMTWVCATFVFVSKQGIYLLLLKISNMSLFKYLLSDLDLQLMIERYGYILGSVCLVMAIVWFTLWYRKFTNENKE